MSKVFVLSDGSKNSHGFSIDMAKLHLDRFMANPVMLYNHKELVGRWSDLKREGDELRGLPNFMEDEKEELALKIKKRVDDGFVKGASLGIHILKVDNSGDIPKVEAEVIECSVVDIPSNANALALYDEDGNKLNGEAFQLAVNQLKKQPKTNDTMKLSNDTYQALGLEAGAGESELDDAVKNLADKNTKLQAEIDKRDNERIDDIVNLAIKEGRITADKKEKFTNLMKKDFELGKETLEDLPKKKTLAGKEQREGKEGEEDRSEWSFEDWRKKDTAGLLSIKKEDPDKYAEIISK